MSETTKFFPKGITVFPKHANSPDFVLASVVITPNDLVSWCKENAALMSDYKGNKQLKLQLLNGKEGKPYFQVDTYKPKETAPKHIPDKDENSPF